MEKLGELDDDIDDLTERIGDIKLIRHPEEASCETERGKYQHKLLMMQRRRFQKIVK